MKIWKKSWYRCPFLFKSRTQALSPVVGTLLVLLITIILISVIANAIFISPNSHINSRPLMAKISIESCEGGLSKAKIGENATFAKNKIILIHQGGDPLFLNKILIRISGYGNAYRGTPGKGGGFLAGSTEVIYENLSPAGKNHTYMDQNNATLKDGFWSVGEELVLHGRDSLPRYSSVRVSVNREKTKNNYGFKADSEITLKLIDIENVCVISEQTVSVKHTEN
ncbi:MAG: type IV pilin [Methanosarcina sp.]